MNKILPLVLALALMSCSAPTTQPTPEPAPLPTPGANVPTTDQVTPQRIAFGYFNNQRVTQPFTGEWKVLQTPAWLQYSRGTGETLDLTLRAVRGAADFQELTQPEVQGNIVIAWTSKDGTKSGQTTWPVTLTMYEVSGTLVPFAATGQDIGPTDRAAERAPREQGDAAEYIVTYRTPADRDTNLPKVTRRALTSAHAGQGRTGKPEAQVGPLGTRSLLLRGPGSADLEALRGDPEVVGVQPNAELRLQAVEAPLEPQDQYYPNQWALRMLGYPAVWRDMDDAPYRKPVVVAVLDTGVRYDHPDLAGILLKGTDGALDLVPRERSDDDNGVDSDPTDPNYLGRTLGSHGTHVTGIIAARWGSFTPPCVGCSASGGVGATYTAPVKVLPIRVIDATGKTTVAETVNGIRYAAGLPVTVDGSTFVNPTPAQVLNLSLGNTITADAAAPLCDAVSEVRKKGVLVFAAAGNYGTNEVNYPAGCPDAVAVAAVTVSRSGAPEHSTFSSAYSQVRLSAPGGAGNSSSVFNGSVLNGVPFPDDIMSTNWDYTRNLPNYSGASGTSQATPQVAALAALMLSKGVTVGAEDTLSRLEATATDLGPEGRDDLFGYGMINPAAALGAPAVGARAGLQVYASGGQTYGVRLSGTAFVGYLPEGTYTLVYGQDINNNGTYGEAGEAHVLQHFTLGTSNPKIVLNGLGR